MTPTEHINIPLLTATLTSPSLPYAHGGPLTTGRIRTSPEDFIVREWLGFEATGSGEHLLLSVRKRGANTKWVAQQLAKRAGIRMREVSFAGLKDRHALTEQAFSLLERSTKPQEWLGFGRDLNTGLASEGEYFEVIAAARHLRKLKRGSHRANDFDITVRDFVVDPALLEQRLQQIASLGVPNYFGEQRFGREGGNLDIAEQWLCHGVPPPDRDARSFALSAARSALFNTVLSARIAAGNWNCLLAGEMVNLDDTGSVFAIDAVDTTLAQRCQQFDVHPTAPLCGCGESRVSGAAAEFEEQALQPWQQWQQGLIDLRVQQQRRATRLVVQNLSWSYDDAVLTLHFRLMRGAFATAVLRELVDYQQQPHQDGPQQ
jgi:tRNA pseudouridine13 synthase